MQFTIPDVNETLDRLMAVESTFEGTTQAIRQWVSKHRVEIKESGKPHRFNVDDHVIASDIFQEDSGRQRFFSPVRQTESQV